MTVSSTAGESRAESALGEVSVVDAVFADRGPRELAQRRQALLYPWVFALLAHGVVLAAAQQSEPSLETWSARMAATIHKDLSDQAPVAIEDHNVEAEPEPPGRLDPPVPAPTPPAEVEPAARRPSAAVAQAERPLLENAGQSESESEGEPAGAGEIIAVDADPSDPVDFTGDTFVTGTASMYQGGATTSGGTNQARPVPRAQGSGTASRAGAGGPNRARPVRLAANEWRCDWPAAALERDVYEQFVVLRVLVQADGAVEDVSVVNDPGFGFGAAAEACARRTRFTPARDASGRATRAASPPIRVRFTR